MAAHRERFGRLDVLAATTAAVISWTQDMIQTADIATSVRFLLDLPPACVVPEIIFQRPGEAI